MRIVGSTEVGGIEYQAIWSTWPPMDNPTAPAKKSLAIRDENQTIQTLIRRNAKLADVESSLRQLRTLGLNHSQLSRLFNYKGDEKGLAQHIKVLVSRLN